MVSVCSEALAQKKPDCSHNNCISECVNSCVSGIPYYPVYKRSNGGYYGLTRAIYTKKQDKYVLNIFELTRLDDKREFSFNSQQFNKEFKLVPDFYVVSTKNLDILYDVCDPKKLMNDFKTKCATRESRGE